MGLENNNNDTAYNEDSRIVAELHEAISDDDSFTEQETDHEDSDSFTSTLTSFDVIPPTRISHDRDSQLERDIQMLSQAIAQPGKWESGKIKAHTLLKSVLLLYFGDIAYRNKQDQQFHALRELNAYSGLENFPIASILLHGSRALIEFPSEISEQLIEWLIPDQTSWRYAATHGIKKVKEEENKSLENKPTKHLQEIKVSGAGEIGRITYHVLDRAFSLLTFKKDKAAYPQHYGIDVALGGVGNQNPFSGVMIEPNGEHGHLYVNYHAAKEGKHGGLLLGIEQSAPGKPDQYGGTHDLATTKKNCSVSGGDFFCKAGDFENLPIDNYYDSIWNFISNQHFDLIQESYHTVCVLVDLLCLDPRTKDESINFIKEIVSSSGQGNEETFNKIANKYFVKTNLYQSQQANFNMELKALEEKNQLSNKSPLSYFNAQLQAQVRTFEERAHCLKESLQKLEQENKLTKQALASTLMKRVESNMGRFSKRSKKKIIFKQLINKLNSKEGNELNENDLFWILKNFIGVAMMNRYDKKGRPTRSGKACLSLLNDSNYKPLKALLLSPFSQAGDLQYDDLFSLLSRSSSGDQDQRLLASARYKQALYTSFGFSKTVKSIPEDKLSLTMREFIYKPR